MAGCPQAFHQQFTGFIGFFRARIRDDNHGAIDLLRGEVLVFFVTHYYLPDFDMPLYPAVVRRRNHVK